jgi:hypothetical protein
MLVNRESRNNSNKKQLSKVYSPGAIEMSPMPATSFYEYAAYEEQSPPDFQPENSYRRG